LQRFNLKTLTVEKTFNLPVDPEWGQTYTQEMHVVPGSPQSIVVELFANVDPTEDGAALYNDSGLVNWIPNNHDSVLSLDSFTFTSPTTIYGLPANGTFFSELQVSSNGLSVVTPSGSSCCDQNTGSLLASDGKLLYTNSGEVWNPTTQTLLGTYLDPSGSQLFYVGRPVPDTANGHTYFLDPFAGYGGIESLNISVYDQISDALENQVPFLNTNFFGVTDLARWGSNGLAFRNLDITGVDPGADQIVILVTSKVTSSVGAPQPIVSSVSPSSIYVGGPAQTLQVIGSGFTNLSTVLINGTPRSTTFVGESSLSVQVLPSDIPVTSGQMSVQVTTPAPGGGTSNYVVVSLTTQRPVITVVPSSLNVTTAQMLTLAVSVNVASGYPVPTGTVAVSSTVYSSGAVTLSGGGATVQLPAGSLVVGTVVLTVTYIPDSASASLYNSTSENTTVAVGSPGEITPTVSVHLSSSSITTAQEVTVTATVSGGGGNPTPTGNLTITLGGTPIAGIAAPNLQNGSGTISIQGFALPAGSDTLMVNYTPDSSSSSTYNSAIGTATVEVSTPPALGTGLQFIPVTPCRIADTRNPAGPFGGPEPAAGSITTFNIPQSACNIPSTAVAYSLNVTVVPTGSLNYLTMWPSGQPQPNVSTLNSDGRVKANAAIVPAGTNGGVSIFVTDPTQVILDIDGYFVPAGATSALAFYPVTPCRIADTRNAAGPLAGPFLSAATSRAFPILSSNCGLPSTAQAYSLNVTAIPHTTLNYLTIWPTGEAQPNASTLNSSTGAVTANAAIVPAGGSGNVSVFVYNDADVILDVNGYFAPPATGGLSLYTAAPCRVIDTRPIPFIGTTVVSVQGSTCAQPSTAETYVLNATVVPDGALNYLTLWPSGASQPNVSTLNADDGAITSNMGIVDTNNGAIDAYADGTTNLILDLSGYFAP